MKAIFVFAALLAVVSCSLDCYDDIRYSCDANLASKQKGVITQCDSKYGGFESAQSHLQMFTNNLFYKSFDFLLMATHYGTYMKNRPGFEKVFRGMSDDLWSDGIDMIKYITSRGGEMNFANIGDELLSSPSTLDLYELQAMGKALDVEKKLAKDVLELHNRVAEHKESRRDAEVGHYLEEKFMGKQREKVRELAGYVKDLTSLLSSRDASLSLYLFDEYLQNK